MSSANIPDTSIAQDTESIKPLKSKEDIDDYFTDHSSQLLNYIKNIVRGDLKLAEDMFQESWISARGSVHKFQGKSKLSTWIYAVARNKTISYLRKPDNKNIDFQSPLQNDDDDGYCSNPLLNQKDTHQRVYKLQKEAAEEIRIAMEKLSPEHRQVINLHCFHDKKYSEIAEQLDIREETARTRHFYAIKAMQKILKKNGIESSLDFFKDI